MSNEVINTTEQKIERKYTSVQYADFNQRDEKKEKKKYIPLSKRCFSLTERDVQIIEPVKRFLFLSLEQINDLGFDYEHSRYCSGRLAKLRKAGFLKMVQTHLLPKYVFMLDGQGKKALVERGHKVSKKEPRITPVTFRHTMAANSVIQQLELSFPGLDILGEYEAKKYISEVSPKKLPKFPDLFISAGEEAVIWGEVELVRKSRGRYIDILSLLIRFGELFHKSISYLFLFR